jgi:multidrug efflux pump subunit AcrA (membrane-fusion protein)
MKNKSSTSCKNSGASLFRPGTDQPNTKWKRIAASLAIGLGATVAAIAFTQSSRAIPVASSQRPLLTVHTAAMNPVDRYTVKRTFLGRVEAARSSDVGFELAGKISSIEVDEGDKITKGEALAYLDLDRLQARREELAAALDQTQANLKLADVTYRRYQKIVASGGVSQQQLDEAKEHFRASEAGVQLARSRIATIAVEIL